jgi:hypothetical protein
MTQLRVKQGREYVLGGKVYRGGDIVDVPEKNARVLTLPKMPLEACDAPGPTDLPKAVIATPAAERPSQGASRRRYQRRDMQAQANPDGQTGAPPLSPSSPPAPQPGEPTSEASGDESAS